MSRIHGSCILITIALVSFAAWIVFSPPTGPVGSKTEGSGWDPARIVEVALEWKKMFDDPAYVEAYAGQFRTGQQRFAARYPGSESTEYRGYISGAFPVHRNGRFLPLTGMGCSRYVWAVFKTVYPDRTWEFMNTEAMFDIIKPTFDAYRLHDVSARQLHEERIRTKAELLGKERSWIEKAQRNFELFDVIGTSARVEIGDLVVWASGPPLAEAGHVGIVVDSEKRLYVGANGPTVGITVESYIPQRRPDGPYFLRWRGNPPGSSR